MAVRPPLCESIPSVYVKWNKVEESLEDTDTDEGRGGKTGGSYVWEDGECFFCVWERCEWEKSTLLNDKLSLVCSN